METLHALYIALAVFGLGVTVVDLFGALDHGDSGHDASGHDAPGHDAGDHDMGHDSGEHDAVGHEAGGHEAGGHEAADHGHDVSGSVFGAVRPEPAGMRRSASVARFIGALRSLVYFSLGAGPTGLVALALGLGARASLLWSVGAGAAIAALARFLRRFLRRDLDSSFKPEDFILEEAQVTVSIAPGLMGKAEVRKYGAASEVYVRAKAGDLAFPRGSRVRIIDYRDDCYLVEAADEQHLVH
jgi:membrane protein implicated in regulation of membrane protease activity